MTQESFGWGIVGLGGMARRMVSAIARASNAHLAAVASRDVVKAQSFAEEHGNARAYGDYDAMLGDQSVQVVYVCTPNVLHAEQSIAALRAGKHVLVEKPMALTVADAESMVEVARSANRTLGVGFHLRHHAVHREIKRLLDAGTAGQPIFTSALWGMYNPTLHLQIHRWQMQHAIAGAGSLMGIGVHEVDLLPWLLGQPIVEVSALADGPSDLYPVEFLTTVSLRFETGVLGQFTCSRRLPNGTNSVLIYGSDQRIEGHETLSMEPVGQLRIVRGTSATETRLPIVDPYQVEVEAFGQSLVDGMPFEASGDDGVRSVAVTVAIVESIHTGKAVSLKANV